jgi:hypothetical protein
VRHVSPSNGATISITLAPANPFIGLAAGSVSPFCAAQMAYPISLRTSGGNARKSFKDDPTHFTGLSVRSIYTIKRISVYLFKARRAEILEQWHTDSF